MLSYVYKRCVHILASKPFLLWGLSLLSALLTALAKKSRCTANHLISTHSDPAGRCSHDLLRRLQRKPSKLRPALQRLHQLLARSRRYGMACPLDISMEPDFSSKYPGHHHGHWSTGKYLRIPFCHELQSLHRHG